MRNLLVAAVVAVLVAPSSAFAAQRPVTISSSTFFPSRALALVGDTVLWTNKDRLAEHNVTFADGTKSPDLGYDGKFERPFAAPGSYRYRCTLHAGMTGSVVVADLHLSGPTMPVLYGRPVTFTGLAPGAATVELRRGTETVASTSAGFDGKFSFPMQATVPGQYYASSAGKSSAAVALKVRPRVAVTTRRSGAAVYLNVSTNPAQAGAPVVLQRRTSSGWARVASARLNSRSKATFRVVPRTTLKLRVQLKAVQGYSPSTSATITIRP